ncbi:MAG: Smr/MutS family protein [Candidatus Thiodiazotropha sp. (ex Epidulcina cf. delphinae)]|nr:Smr/MutS family protein [Candidatus Thiodiazotropha sp. (ex Epidulcina cf. delphinae)]
MSDEQKKTDEKTIFYDALGDVKPLREKRAEPYRRRLPPRPLNLPVGDEDEQERDLYSDSDQEIETTDELYFARPGIQQRVVHDLRRGYLKIGAELDLHGLTVRHSREELSRFIKACQQRDIRCVRIIHGKGYRSEAQQPILKQKLNLWLRQGKNILAFTSATRRDGGTGATYVLLRNPKKRNAK